MNMGGAIFIKAEMAKESSSIPNILQVQLIIIIYKKLQKIALHTLIRINNNLLLFSLPPFSKVADYFCNILNFNI